MADKDDFSFDQKPTSTPPAAPAEQKAKPVPSRALWLGLLLVVLGGAAYFYSLEMTAPEDVPVPAVVTKQLITPPPAAAPAATPSSATGSSDQQEPAAAETAKQASAPAGDSGAPGAAEQAPAVQDAPKLAEKGVLQKVPIKAPKPAAEAGASNAQAVAATAGSGEAAAETQQPAKVADGKTKDPAVAGQPVREGYTLLAGAYVSPVLLKSAISKVRSLGYQPRTLSDAKTVEMTRVRIGVYAPAEAKAKLAELKKIAPDAFILPEGEQVAVYAASHFDPTAHNAFAERLRQAGVTFDEEKALRKLPMTELFFGEFSDREAAEKAAVKGRKAGLDIIVFKRP